MCGSYTQLFNIRLLTQIDIAHKDSNEKYTRTSVHLQLLKPVIKSKQYPLNQVWAVLFCQQIKGVYMESDLFSSKSIIYNKFFCVGPKYKMFHFMQCSRLFTSLPNQVKRDFSIKSCPSKVSLEPFQCCTGNPESSFTTIGFVTVAHKSCQLCKLMILI